MKKLNPLEKEVLIQELVEMWLKNPSRFYDTIHNLSPGVIEQIIDDLYRRIDEKIS